jgi:hypothetical protein
LQHETGKQEKAEILAVLLALLARAAHYNLSGVDTLPLMLC